MAQRSSPAPLPDCSQSSCLIDLFCAPCRYGEKLVKDSPYPRCYYRCMFPECSVKKAVERDPVGGHVSSTIYKVQNASRPAHRAEVSAFGPLL